MCNLKKSSVFVYIPVLMLLLPAGANSEITQLTPGLVVQEEYNDNLFFDVNNEIDDFITTVSPMLSFEQRSERFNISFTGRLNGIFYSDNSALDSWDHSYNGRFGYKVTERAALAGSASYKKDSRADRDIEETGLVLSTEDRDQVRLSISGNYTLTERMGLGLSYRYTDDDFEDSGSLDSTSNNFNLTLTRKLSSFTRPTSIRTGLGYTTYDHPGEETENYRFTIGAKHSFSETLTGDIDVGSRYTETKDEATGQEDDDWGGTGSISLLSKGEFTTNRISLTHRITEASGRTETTERTSFIYGLRHQFLEKFSGNLAAGYYINDGQTIDERTFRIRPSLSYSITDNLGLAVSYTFTSIDNRENDTDKDRSLVFVELSYQYPLFE